MIKRDVISEHKFVLSYFFHPTCHPCIDFIADFDRIPAQLADLDWASDVHYVKINIASRFAHIWLHSKSFISAGGERVAAEMFDVRGYPWISFFKHGQQIRYKGQRNARSIMSFMYRRMMQSFRQIENVDAAVALFEGITEESTVVCFSYFRADSPKLEMIAKLSDHYDHISFVWTTNKTVANSLGMTSVGVGIKKVATPDNIKMMKGKVTKESLTYFFDHFGQRLIMEYNEVKDYIYLKFKHEKRQQLHL